MATTYSQIVRQIESLQRKADAARAKEIAGVVGRIKEAIAFYGLTASELGFAATRATANSQHSGRPISRRTKKRVKSKSKFGDTAKFRDAAGNEWVGRGPRPLWLREALLAGKTLADFAIAGIAQPAAAKKKSKRKGRPSKKKATVAKYKDAASGKTWSGRGRKPGWYIAALAEGKAPESMAA